MPDETQHQEPPAVPPAIEPPAPPSPTWQRVQLARHPKRPYSLDYISRLMPVHQQIFGDRFFADDPAIVCAMGEFEEQPIMIVGQQKGRDTKQRLYRNYGMPKPEGYRKALRAMQLAAKFGRPVVTLLDTPGAYPGIDAEERGQAEAIAVNLREMARLPVPVIVIVIGEGGSGGALAMGLGNRVFILENSIYSVISPESCAAIIWRDSAKAELAAAALKLTAPDLAGLGLVDAIIPEPPGGAQEDHDKAAELMRPVLRKALEECCRMSPAELVEERYQKFRRMASYFADAAVTR
jgi:acetyl-CoA carboxylase carboxyl transferase subunit alpha